jgi:Family of unknown function (DUF5706)
MRTSWLRLAARLRLGDSSATPSFPHESMNSKSLDDANPTTDYLVDLLKDTREELARADSKAALLLAASGVAIGALLAGLLSGKWTPFDLNYRIEWAWWLGVGSTAVGIFSIAAAVYPRHIHRGEASPPEMIAYYGDVVACKDIEQFRRIIEKSPSRERRLVNQIFLLSQVVQHKYVLLRRGMRLLLLAILTCTAAVLINIPLTR